MKVGSKRALCLGTVLGITFACGCDNGSDIRVYDVPATTQHTSAQPASPSGQTMQTTLPASASTSSDGIAGLHWTLPEGWRVVPVEKPMRLATFETTRGERMEISLARFPGDTGGLLANVNRWRQQVGLQPIDEKGLAADLHQVENGSLSGHTMRLRGETQHMLGAILMPADKSESWFLKAIAAPAVIDSNESDFQAFVKSMHLDSQPHQH